MMRPLLLTMLLSTLLAAPALADPVVNLRVQSVSLPTPAVLTTSHLEVFFELTGATSDQLAGYQLVLGLSPASAGVALTGAEATIDHTPVFSPVALTVSASPGGLVATDFLPAGSVPIDDGDGLLRVAFDVQPGTVGVFDVTVDIDPATGTLLSDALGSPIDFLAVDGSITIVPEPAALLLLLTGGLAVTLRRRA